MGLRTIIRMGHPHLRRVAQPVELDDINSDKMNTLLRDMEDTLHDSGGIGLAAPQIDVDLRLAIIEIPGGPTRYGDIEAMPLTVFFNPVIEALTTDRGGYWEGCLSVPGLRGFVERPQHKPVSYIDAHKEPAEIELQGY